MRHARVLNGAAVGAPDAGQLFVGVALQLDQLLPDRGRGLSRGVLHWVDVLKTVVWLLEATTQLE
jgi:hypothetical protein